MSLGYELIEYRRACGEYKYLGFGEQEGETVRRGEISRRQNRNWIESMPDGESFEFARGGHFSGVNLFDEAVHFAANFGGELLDLAGGAFHDDLDAPVRQVSDIAVDVVLDGEILNRIAEPNPLHIAAVMDSSSLLHCDGPERLRIRSRHRADHQLAVHMPLYRGPREIRNEFFGSCQGSLRRIDRRFGDRRRDEDENEEYQCEYDQDDDWDEDDGQA
jgi:hypothetical protein